MQRDVWKETITTIYSLTAGWQRCIGYLKLQVSFRKKATKYRALLRKMASKNKAFYGSLPPCTVRLVSYVWKETYKYEKRISIERDMSKRAVCAWKETYDRDLYMYEKRPIIESNLYEVATISRLLRIIGLFSYIYIQKVIVTCSVYRSLFIHIYTVDYRDTLSI